MPVQIECNKKKVQHEKVQHKKISTKIAQQGKSATQKQQNMKRMQHEKSAT